MKKLFLMIAVMAAIATGAKAQSTTVTFILTNQDEKPLAGAVIQLPDGESGTTNESGEATFKLPSPLKNGTKIVVGYGGLPGVVLIPYFEPANAGVQDVDLNIETK